MLILALLVSSSASGQVLDGGLEFEFGQLIRSLPSATWEGAISETQRNAIMRLKATPDVEQRLLDAIDVVISQPMGDFLLVQGAIEGLNHLDNLSHEAIDRCRALLEKEEKEFGTFVDSGSFTPSWLGGTPENDRRKARMEVRWITMKKCIELLADRGDRSDLERIEFFTKVEGHPTLAKSARADYDRLLARLEGRKNDNRSVKNGDGDPSRSESAAGKPASIRDGKQPP